MPNDFQHLPAHSSEHFNDVRDHWWNLDFLHLMAQRLRLNEVWDMLDVGCGIGHWGMLLAQVMPPHVRCIGIDREADWVRHATEQAHAHGLGERFSYVQGDVGVEIPFADDTFGLVTCQTVLIHLADPAAALAEMVRVTRPGGLIVVAEPNNMTESLLLDSISNQAGIDEIMELVRFQLTCERGKASLGEGDDSLGDRVPGLFAAHGLTDIDVYTNDKAMAIFPPYTAPDQQAYVDDLRAQTEAGLWRWSPEDALRLFLAGGGREPDFAPHYARAVTFRQRIIEGIDTHTYHGIAGGEFYLIAGRKPWREPQLTPPPIPQGAPPPIPHS